jgi:ADP-ribose pyrophosphatase
MLTDKPEGQRVGWLHLDTEYPFIYRMYRIRRDRVILPNGLATDYAYLEMRGAVWVVPVTDDGKIVLIKQYRYAVDDWTWEVPAGGKHDHVGTDEELACRELSEEIGATCRSLEYVGWFYASVSNATEQCQVFLARGVQLGEPRREPGEIIEVHPVPIDEALAMAQRGEIKDGKSALALLLCEPLLPG